MKNQPRKTAPLSVPAITQLSQGDRLNGNIQALHIDLWYANGTTGEINLTSPKVQWGEDIERQYYYMKLYLDKSAGPLGLTAFQGGIVCIEGNNVRIIGQYEKVYCSGIKSAIQRTEGGGTSDHA